MSKAEKDTLRRHAKALRQKLHQSSPKAGNALWAHFPQELLSPAVNIASYISIGSEIDPKALAGELHARGAQLALPLVAADDHMDFRLISDEGDLEPGPFGLTQPKAETAPIDPAIILMPLLAFDEEGNRLGYGKGHYDKALSRLDLSATTLIGLSYAEQEVPHIPTYETDIPLDMILTPSGCRVFSR